jgi:hypothetical protein
MIVKSDETRNTSATITVSRSIWVAVNFGFGLKPVAVSLCQPVYSLLCKWHCYLLIQYCSAAHYVNMREKKSLTWAIIYNSKAVVDLSLETLTTDGNYPFKFQWPLRSCNSIMWNLTLRVALVKIPIIWGATACRWVKISGYFEERDAFHIYGQAVQVLE